jgi:hypothetical protein
MTSVDPQGKPSLHMHKRVYFRIAGKKHSISQPSDLVDNQSVLTAMHLVGESNMKLPVDFKTIRQLEDDYKGIGFDWDAVILPRIQTMLRELFSGMTKEYPAMGQSRRSRALYGVDVMFQIESSGSIQPKLTEVSFCPANNAVCDAYERDEKLYREYNNDVFNCLFLNKCSNNIATLL